MPATCGSCGAPLAGGARFCAMCGTAVVGERPVPDYVVLERRLFGIPPAGVLIGTAVVSLALAIALLALGHWLIGVALLAITSLAFSLAAAGLRTRPESRLATTWFHGSARVRGWAGFSAEAVRAWSELGLERMRLRRRLRDLAAERDREIYALGAAALRRDADAEARARDRIADLDQAWSDCEGAAGEAMDAARRRLAHERELVQPTESLPYGIEAEVGAELSQTRS
jgi:hypothetical protein